MPRLDKGAMLFSVNSFVAAMLALYIGFALGLQRPYWAMTTAYIVSQPLSGAVRSKAVYRVMGTLLGGAAAVAMVPNLVNSPYLLSAAMALWVGGCLAISLLDRTPRSYMMMLAGYTAAIIGFPSVTQPGSVFDVTVSREIEIGLGILCATLVHSLVFPRPVGEAVRRRLEAWLTDADRWALDILRARDSAVASADRRHLAAAASEIQILAVHLPFDTSRLRETTSVVSALHERMLRLIPLLSGLSDRMTALAGVSDVEVRAILDAVANWIEAGCPRTEGVVLAERIEATVVARETTDWSDMLLESLLVRLSEMVTSLTDSHALMRHLDDPDAPLEAEVAAATGAGRRKMHADLPLALLSGAAASIAIMFSCVLWIGAGWGDGATAAVMCSVFCCFFASMDDPVPAIVNFGIYSLISLPIAAIYEFAILPAIDGFPMLVMVMAPTLLVIGYFIPNPRRTGSMLAVTIGFSNALTLQETFTADFANFMNANLSQFVGLFCAIFVTAAMRSMGAEASVRRLLGQTWKGLARLARAQTAPEPTEFAAQLIDRLGLLTPKLAAGEHGLGEATAVEALRDLRVGMNLVAIQALRPTLNGAPRAAVEALLVQIGDHFDGLSAGRGRSGPTGAVPPQMLERIDAALRGVSSLGPGQTARGVTGLVGLRRNLFPNAPPYAPVGSSEVLS
ncbi:MAG: FUSC family protein [Caulobacteraceae bacterium]|nr:FUSC family protein [Caulobacteraceae bacterium]